MKKQIKRKLLTQPEMRSRILSAAQEVFAEKGYSGAGIRDIAAVAGVSSTLLLRYFGTKLAMYEAALEDIIPAEVSFDQIDRRELGKTFVRVILNSDWNLKTSAMVALAIGDQDARDATVRLTEEKVVGPLAKWLGAPHAEARALEIIMVSFGFLVYSRRLPVVPHVVGENKDTGKWLAQTIQAIVDRST